VCVQPTARGPGAGGSGIVYFGKKEKIKNKTRIEKQKYTQVYRAYALYI
jgi:hypothetical protein